MTECEQALSWMEAAHSVAQNLNMTILVRNIGIILVVLDTLKTLIMGNFTGALFSF